MTPSLYLVYLLASRPSKILWYYQKSYDIIKKSYDIIKKSSKMILSKIVWYYQKIIKNRMILE